MTEPEPPPIQWTECSCGGVITADRKDQIEEAVRHHNDWDVRHLRWALARIRKEFLGYE